MFNTTYNNRRLIKSSQSRMLPGITYDDVINKNRDSLYCCLQEDGKHTVSQLIVEYVAF